MLASQPRLRRTAYLLCGDWALASDPFNLSYAGDTVLFQGDELVLRYDLVTGTLSQLGVPGAGPQPPLGAGSYVSWCDQSGGHVADIPH